MDYHNPHFLTSPDELLARLGNTDLRILDASVFLVAAEGGYHADSGQARYDEAHIPGAVFMDQVQAFSDISTGLGFSLPSPEALAGALGVLGVNNQHEVVIYVSGHMMWATRAWWLLRYCGHDRVSVLNGGFEDWCQAGLPTSTETASFPTTTYQPNPRPEIFVAAAEVVAAMHAPGVCTVNALSPDVYAGIGEMHYGRRGHIPGSLNLHYDELLVGSRFKSADELGKALGKKGLLDAERVIAYCGGGISATIDAFACLLVGKEAVTVYDGSMAEWVRESLPLVTGLAPNGD